MLKVDATVWKFIIPTGVASELAPRVAYAPFVKVPENIIDGYIIAELELQQKKIPFIIKRPMPGGGFEYWHLRDLELISF